MKNTTISFQKLCCQAIYPGGEKDTHQYRIKNSVLLDYRDKIVAAEKEIIECKTFEDILKICEKATIKGIGELTVYDVAFRLGYQMVYLQNASEKLLPDKIYLHAGTKQGALKAELIQKWSRKKSLALEELPNRLQKEPPYMIENFLCVYKDRLDKNNLSKCYQKYCQEEYQTGLRKLLDKLLQTETYDCRIDINQKCGKC